MAKKVKKVPRSEEEVIDKIASWCNEKHPRVEVQKSEYEKLIESTGEKKIIDTTLIGRYKRKARTGGKGLLIAELELEEHQQKKYSILKDMLKITVPLRKLSYFRQDIAQYWLKVDSDGTPFMINYWHIYNNQEDTDSMPAFGKFTKHDQLTRIIAARRETKKSGWPRYVIVGWDKIFKELSKIIRKGRF